MDLQHLVPILQLSVGPVILISGVGLLLLSMTNRYGRVIDRARVLSEGFRKGGDSATRSGPQLRVLARRARLLRAAITAAALSLLLAAVLVVALFLVSLLAPGLGSLIAIVFVACLTSLVVSLIFFLVDLNVSLRALELELPAEALKE